MEKLENAVVDLRRLQLLNDRICQTLDALNQVKLSSGIGGLSHTGAYPTNVGCTIPQTLGANPYANPYVNSGINSFVDPRFVPVQGLGHTSAINPYFTGFSSPVINPMIGSVDPRFIQGAGLSHSTYGMNPSFDARIANDMWLNQRARWNTIPYGYVNSGLGW